MFISLILIPGILFFRELFCFILVWIADAKPVELSTEDIKIQAKTTLPIQVVLSRRNIIEFCCFSTWFKRFFMVDERLWNELSCEQRQSLLIWGYSAQIQRGFLRRLFKSFNVSASDRDCLVLGGQLQSLLSTLGVISNFRRTHEPSSLGTLLTGLSSLGPSVLDAWPPMADREAKLLAYLADWSKER